MMTAATSKYVSSSSPPTRTTVDHAHAARVPSEMSVSIVADEVARALERRAVEPHTAPEDDGRREHERDPFPARELKGRDHRRPARQER